MGRRAASLTPVRSSPSAARCRRKFLRFFPNGFQDETYLEWERNYKWKAHELWNEWLNQVNFRALLRKEDFKEAAQRAVRIEARTNLLFSFEKMALRDAIRTPTGAQSFAMGLYDLLHGKGSTPQRFGRWVETLGLLPRKQTRVLTWPLATVFQFIAQPDLHVFLKPNVTRRAAREFGFDFKYESQPSWPTYASLLAFGDAVRHEVRALRPQDMIDIQSFIWVQGSDEYEE
jgi:hypothetical protein